MRGRPVFTSGRLQKARYKRAPLKQGTELPARLRERRHLPSLMMIPLTAHLEYPDSGLRKIVFLLSLLTRDTLAFLSAFDWPVMHCRKRNEKRKMEASFLVEGKGFVGVLGEAK